MRNWIVAAAVLAAVLADGIACSQEGKKAQADSTKSSVAGKKAPADTIKQTEAKEEAPLVTFVELGSVKCVPCKKMQPIMKEIEEEYAGRVKVVFHDVWTEEGKPYKEKYRIRVIPTQVFLDRDGREYFRHEGYFPKEELVKILKQKGV